MRINPELTLRQVGDEYMVVNPFTDTIDTTKIYTLNETAAWIWEQMENKVFTSKDIAAALCKEYEVSDETALSDAEELCKNWQKAGIIIE